MTCTTCSERHSLEANYCKYCGTALREGLASAPPVGHRWEVRRVNVPLGVRWPCTGTDFETWGKRTAYREEYRRLVDAALQQYDAEGWECLGPLGSDAAIVDQRITLTEDSIPGAYEVFGSVALRLRRAVLAKPPA